MDRSELWRVYEEAGAAVERQIDRSWSTTQFFLGLNATVAAGALALLQWRTTTFALVTVAILLFGGAALAGVGLRVLRVNKRYYRALSYKRYLLADALGLTRPLPGREGDEQAIPIVSANATRNKIEALREAGPGYVDEKLRRGSQADWARVVFLGFALLDTFAALALLASAVACSALAACLG